MKKNLFLLLFALSVLLISCKKEASATDFTALTKSYFDDKNALNPLGATQSGQNEYNDQLQFEMTDSYRKKQEAFYEKYETALSNIDTSTLSEEELNSYEIMKWEIAIGKEMLQYPTNLMPISQFEGTHLTIGQMAGGTGAQPFKTEKDYTNFLKRMELYSQWIDSAMVYMKKGLKEGVVLPKALTEKMIPQFEGMPTAKVEDNLFYSAVKLMPTTFSATTKQDIATKYNSVITTKLIPQYQKMTAFLKTEYLPASRATSGISSLSFGKNLYASYAKQWTTTTTTPEAIHELGLKEVARIRGEMEKVKAQVGFKGTLLAFFAEVRNKKELMPYTTPEEVIANFNNIHKAIEPKVNQLFALQPKSKFEVRRTEAFREQSASAEYNQGTADGSRPGIFYVPIPDVTKYNTSSDESLFLHEAIPGHHFQISLQQENANLPDFRKYNWFGAYGEGWALYTESLGKELGLYTNPYYYFGTLSAEMHRAIRLVVDTGLHAKGWTREQAIAYSLENESRSEASIIAEIERYMAIPGQALSYKMGQLKIKELKEKAKATMGPQFDIKKYHEKVLESGCLPLALLETKIDNWIAKK
jgi:uncharacterized protein (DUF885 family)